MEIATTYRARIGSILLCASVNVRNQWWMMFGYGHLILIMFCGQWWVLLEPASLNTHQSIHTELILIITWLKHLFKAALVFSSLALCQFGIYNPFVVSFIQLLVNGLIQKTFKFLKELCMFAYTYLYMWTEWGNYWVFYFVLNVLLLL